MFRGSDLVKRDVLKKKYRSCIIREHEVNLCIFTQTAWFILSAGITAAALLRHIPSGSDAVPASSFFTGPWKMVFMFAISRQF
jgi:hypothetical protein